MAPVTRNTERVPIQPSTHQAHQGNMGDLINSQPTATPGSSNNQRRVRGPTFMCKVWGQPEDKRIPIAFNDKGLPITNNSVLSHFLGSIARNGKYAPLHYKTWKKMPDVYKNDMVALVLQKFDISPGHKFWILKSLSKKWRNWKATVKSSNFDLNLPIEEQVRNPPDRVQADQWRELVKLWHEKDVQERSEKNKDSRGKQTTIYRMGKTPLAVVRESKIKKLGHEPSRADLFITCFTKNGVTSNEELGEKIEKMRELMDEVPEGEHDMVGPSDIFSQVMGKEKPGHVRMFGLGVCPSDVWGTIPSSGTSYRMAMEWKTELEKTNSQLEELRAVVMQREANGVNPTNVPVISPNRVMGSSSSAFEQRRIKVGDNVSLKSVVNPTEIVGKGRVISMNPSAVVGGEELGVNWCEVQVQVPIKWDEHLMRPYGGLKTIGDAIGTPIAWPISLVLDDEDW